MKNILLLTFIFLTQVTFGQEVTEIRTATLVDGDYSLDGTVYLELFDDNSLQLRFDSDYLTQTNVFDVHVFLNNDNNYSEPIDTTGMLLISNIGTIDGLNYSSGAMTFSLPSGIGINDYQNIVFICVGFGGLHWGDGEFGESIPTNTTSIKEVYKEGIYIYPNPSENGRSKVQFKSIQQNILLELLNISGQIISREILSVKQFHDLEIKNPGTYYLRIISDDGAMVKKIVRL